MAIKSRLVILSGDKQIPASQTDLASRCAVMPKTGKIKSIKGWILTKGGVAAAQFNIYKSGAAGSTAAASTTAVNSAAMDMTSDAIVTASLTDANTRFIAGEVLYLKATTGAGTTIDDFSVTIEVDY